MEQLISEVKELVEREYGRGAALHGCTLYSDHESYAVILEEKQETEEALDLVSRRLQLFWELVRNDSPDDMKLAHLRNLETAAVQVAAEAIQVAQLAKKAAITVCDRNAKEELGCVSTSESTPANPAPSLSSRFTETGIEKLKSNLSQSPDTSES